MASGATNIIPQILLEILYSIANGNRFQKVSPKRQNFEMFFPLFIGFFIYSIVSKNCYYYFFYIVFFFYLQKFLLVISLFVRSFNL
jgi:hypothetical protein